MGGSYAHCRTGTASAQGAPSQRRGAASRDAQPAERRERVGRNPGRQSGGSGGAGAAMSLIVLGINHTTADIAVREKLAIGERQLPVALEKLGHIGAVAEAAVLSTCNRTEVYAVITAVADDPEDLLADF